MAAKLEDIVVLRVMGWIDRLPENRRIPVLEYIKDRYVAVQESKDDGIHRATAYKELNANPPMAGYMG